MASENDILRLIVTARLAGELVQNVYHYRVQNIVGGGGTDFINSALISRWTVDVFPDILAVQSEDVQYSTLEAQNLNDLLGDTVLGSAAVGDVVGESLPSLVAWSFQLRPTTKAIRHGRKSFAGIPETDISVNAPDATAVPLLAALELSLAATLVHPNANFIPVVARIPAATPRPYVPFSVDVSEAIFRGVGTQYTRKLGRGA